MNRPEMRWRIGILCGRLRKIFDVKCPIYPIFPFVLRQAVRHASARSLGTCCIAAMALAGVARSATVPKGVTASTKVDTTEYLIGDWIDVTIRLDHPPGASFTSLTGDTLGPFLVLEKAPVQPVSSVESTVDFRIAIYDTGRVTVPPFEFMYTLGGDTTDYRVSTDPFDLAIHPVPVDTTADIKDIKPPVDLAVTWRDIALPVAVVLAVVLLGWLIYRFLKHRGRAVREKSEPVDIRPPHVVALERLKAIEEKKLWQRGLLKPYYSEVTEVVREYLEGRYGMPALEMTTDEILHQLRSIDVPDEVKDEIEKMLGRADLVKFAKYGALPEENDETMAKAYSVVETTKENWAGDGSEDDDQDDPIPDKAE